MNKLAKSLMVGTLVISLVVTASPKSVQAEGNVHAQTSNIFSTIIEKIKSFKDVLAGSWFYTAITDAVNKGYVDGMPDGTFKPNQTVTQAEYIKMVVAALNPSKDYSKGAGEKWYTPYFNEAISLGLISSNEFSNATLEKDITRQDMAKIGARAIGLSTSDEKQWMYLATSKGLIKGTDAKGTLKENGHMTRAEAVTVIERVLKVKNGETLPTDKRAIANAEILWHNTNMFTMLPQVFKTSEIETFDMSPGQVTMTNWNGNYSTSLKRITVIDLSDKNDPNLHLLKDFEIITVAQGEPLYNHGYVLLTDMQLNVKEHSLTRIHGGFVTAEAPFEVKAAYKVKPNILNIEMHENFVLDLKPEQNVYNYKLGIWIPSNAIVQENDKFTLTLHGMIEWGYTPKVIYKN